MKNTSKEQLTVEIAGKIMVKGNETLDDVFERLLFAKLKNENKVVIMHKEQVVCPKCKSECSNNGHQSYGKQTCVCKNNNCSYEFVPSETIPRTRQSLGNILQGLECLYKDEMKLKEASKKLKEKEINISYDGLRKWKEKAPDVLRVLVNNIEAKADDMAGLIAVEAIKKKISWLKLDQMEKRVSVSFYTPTRIKKRIKRKRRTKIIEKHEMDDAVRLDIKKPITIELNKKDELSNKVLMVLLSHSNKFTNPELADMFNMDARIVNKDINKFKKLGAVGLVDIAVLKKKRR